MKPIKLSILKNLMLALLVISFTGCSDDDDPIITPDPDPVDPPITVSKSTEYDLNAVAVADISGKATFIEYSDNTVAIELELSNTPAGGQHPAHIHYNTAAEGGDVALTLGTVDGTTGKSSITVSALNDGTAIGYDDLVAFDGYINVHLSSDDLETIVAQGDIGENALTGTSKSYDLLEKAVPGISGTVTFFERINGEALSVIELSNTPEGGIHPAHIHDGNALEGGGIAVSLNPVDGTSGMSKTSVSQLDDGTAVSYDDLLDFNGYINVHLSAEELATIVAQGDIGGNELSGSEMMYMLGEKDVAGISGMVHFYKRNNGETLAKLELMNTPEGGIHPAHIHNNSAIEGGGIAVSLTPVDGTTGMSYTNIRALDDGSALTYDQLMDFDGYINVHLSPENLAVIVAQGDIGQNELTGMSIMYDLGEKDVPGISGMATFYERKSGEALAMIKLMNTPAGGVHPAHIHNNSAAEGGGIAFSFNPVDGDTGMSYTHLAQLDDGSSFGFDDIETFDGYINVHLSPDNLATIVAQGNIGSNLNDNGGGEGEAVTYAVGNTGSSAYVFTGGDLNNESNPDFTFKRGQTYIFNVNAPGHPFLIKTTETLGTGDSYDNGVTNNGAATDTITFTVPMDAPDTLFYICEFHAEMAGTINIVD
ncbi:superoxide dismutase family protein [Lutimonas saemankumensis]|uniref:CHRD domain-containing protein n=1 Tax=Lutimonas saemankumensis TaxID=483016 RepID=UPI001CD6E879|nr:CHRD domain-containing protein [Lutimonas saemankumensis]MCA0931827.1 superoxide dismutase family protein [Lutimonas saemankumensis]